jgi:hypothetical protein
MPIDDIPSLQTQIQTQVLDKIAIPFDKAQIDPLLEEINQNFVQLQNSVLFQKHINTNHSASKMFSKEITLDFSKKKIVPYYGRIQLKR